MEFSRGCKPTGNTVGAVRARVYPPLDIRARTSLALANTPKYLAPLIQA